MKRKHHIIGACSCWGAQIRDCELGPEDLAQGGVFDRLQDLGISIEEIEMIYPQKRAKYEDIPLSQALPLIHDFSLRIAHAVAHVKKSGAFPVVIGGDHANAVGTWNGIGSPLGLIWIDAHMDAHTMETTPSGAYHGMPVAALLGYGAPEMAQLLRKEPVLQPQNFAAIGIRSYEEGEEALLKKLNVKVYFIDEVKKRGLAAILPEAIAHVTRSVPKFGVSLDLDVFDPDEAPGVGSPEKGGLFASGVIPHLSHFRKDERFAAFEMVEFNPRRDVAHKTRELMYKILLEIMK
jgi:arginase